MGDEEKIKLQEHKNKHREDEIDNMNIIQLYETLSFFRLEVNIATKRLDVCRHWSEYSKWILHPDRLFHPHKLWIDTFTQECMDIEKLMIKRVQYIEWKIKEFENKYNF